MKAIDPWDEYYRLRKRARLAVLAFPIVVLMLGIGPIADWLSLVLQDLGPTTQVIFLVFVIGLVSVLMAVPLLQWASWRCPRCGEKFVQPPGRLGFSALVQVARKLTTDSVCASCQLPCGERTSQILS